MNVMKKIIIAIIASALLVLLCASSVQAPIINGVVKLHDRPVSGVKVTVTAPYAYWRKGETTVSDDQGRFHTGALHGLRLLFGPSFSYELTFEYKNETYSWFIMGDGDLTGSVENVTCPLDKYDPEHPSVTCQFNEP